MDVNGVLLAFGAVCSAIILVGGAITIVKGWVKPIATIRENVDKLSTRIESLEKTMEKEGRETRACTSLLFRIMLGVLEKGEPQDDTGLIKRLREEAQDYLTKF